MHIVREALRSVDTADGVVSPVPRMLGIRAHECPLPAPVKAPMTCPICNSTGFWTHDARTYACTRCNDRLSAPTSYTFGDKWRAVLATESDWGTDDTEEEATLPQTPSSMRAR